MSILVLTSSLSGAGSVSNSLVTRAVERLTAARPGVAVVRRDLAANPIPHLDADGAAGVRGEPASEAQRAARATSDALIAELIAADTLVIGAPMYNFGIPTRLKAWLDSISIPRKTFRYTEKGPEGLAGGRKVVVAYASGGFHRGPEEDFVDPYLRSFFRLLGIKDIDVVRAEGLNMSEDHRARAMQAANAEICGIAARIREERRQTADA